MADLTAQAIDSIVALAKRAHGAELIARDETPQSLWLRTGETMQEVKIPPPLRKPKLAGIEDITVHVEDMVEADAPILYHDHESVIVVRDKADGRERATMKLVESERFLAVRSLAKGRSFDVRSAIKFLRFEIGGHAVQAVIDAIRRIDFDRASQAKVDVVHGRESLGKSVEAKVQQADKIPEEFQVAVPVYVNPGLRGQSVEMRVGIFLDVAGEAIEFRLVADEISRAIQTAQDYLHHSLVSALGDGIPVLNGQP